MDVAWWIALFSQGLQATLRVGGFVELPNLSLSGLIDDGLDNQASLMHAMRVSVSITGTTMYAMQESTVPTMHDESEG